MMTRISYSKLCQGPVWFHKAPLVLFCSLQILYANEGESKKEQEVEPLPIGEKSSYICHKGHEFIPTLYHFPTNCEACTKPLWNMFKPPPALECRRCHIKCHKDHMDKKEEVIAPCRGGKCGQCAHLYTIYIPYSNASDVSEKS